MKEMGAGVQDAAVHLKLPVLELGRWLSVVKIVCCANLKTCIPVASFCLKMWTRLPVPVTPTLGVRDR